MAQEPRRAGGTGLLLSLAALVVVGALVFRPHGPAAADPSAATTTPSETTLPASLPADLRATTTTTAEEASDATKADDGEDGLTFHGQDCTVDCSGHRAGYEWAELHEIDDPDACGGNSESFIEGCRSYAEEQQGEKKPDDDDDS